MVQWAHFVPRYNAWFRSWAQAWGEQNDVEVSVDLETYTLLPELAAAEVKRKRGHDVFGFLSPPARYEDQVIDHSAIVRQIEKAVGPYGDLGKRSTYNPKTKRYFGVSDYHVPAPLIWRHDLWNEIGESPATWEHVLAAAPTLKAAGHPIGIGLANEADSNVALLSLMLCFGVVPAGRVREAGSRQREHRRRRRIHGRAPPKRRRELRARLVSDLEQPVRALRARVADRERDLTDPARRGSRHAFRPRSLDLADARRAAGKARPGAVHERLLDLEVREESRPLRRSSSQTSASRRARPSPRRRSSTTRPSRARARRSRSTRRRRRTYGRREASTRSWRRSLPSTRGTSGIRDTRTQRSRTSSTPISFHGCSRRSPRAG